MMDFRRRNLMVLGVASFASVVLAAVALVHEAHQTSTRFVAGPFLPGFSARVKDSAQIHVVSHSGAFDVVYDPARGWVLPAKGGYPADFNQVRRTLLGMAALETIEPKTARPDWLSYVGLDTPPKGNGIEILVSDAKGRKLASIITGNQAQLDDAQGGNGLFVRRPDDDQSYLARAIFTPHADLSDWVNTDVMNVDGSRIATVTVAPFAGEPYTVAREHSSDTDYKLEGPPPPKGMSANAAQVSLVPEIVSGFAFTDVKPASALDFSKAAHLSAHTFDNQNIHMDAVLSKDAVWVKISAMPDPHTPTAQKQEADMINARAGNWAYELATDKGQFFSMTRDRLFTKAAAAAQPGGEMPAMPMPFGAGH